MEQKQKDSVYGFVTSSFPLYANGIDQTGIIYICEKGLVIKNEGHFIRAPLEYVRGLERVEEMPLGKVSMIMRVFDQMGQEYSFAAGIADMNYEALVKMCPNSQGKAKGKTADL